jgi:hypothetical protein
LQLGKSEEGRGLEGGWIWNVASKSKATQGRREEREEREEREREIEREEMWEERGKRVSRSRASQKATLGDRSRWWDPIEVSDGYSRIKR